MRDIKEIKYLNDNLRKKNQSLIRELARYGIVWKQEISPILITDQITKVPNSSFSSLPETRELQPTLTHNDTIRGTNIDHSIYRQPSRNTIAPPIFPTPQHNGQSSVPDPLHQAKEDGSEQNEEYWKQEEAVIASMLRELTQRPFSHTSAHIVHNINKIREGIPRIQNTPFEGNHEFRSLKNNFVSMI